MLTSTTGKRINLHLEGQKCIFVGYPFTKKVWKVYDLESGELFVSRDVISDEDIFPYEVTNKSVKIKCQIWNSLILKTPH